MHPTDRAQLRRTGPLRELPVVHGTSPWAAQLPGPTEEQGTDSTPRLRGLSPGRLSKSTAPPPRPPEPGRRGAEGGARAVGAHTRQKRPKGCTASARRGRCHRGWGGGAPGPSREQRALPTAPPPSASGGLRARGRSSETPVSGAGARGPPRKFTEGGVGTPASGGGNHEPPGHSTGDARPPDRRAPLRGDSPGAGPSPRFPGPPPAASTRAA